MIALVLVLIILYVALGIMLLLMKDMLSDNFTLDLGDLFSGRMESEEQNKAVLFITFWPVIIFFYLVKFIFIAMKAVYNAVVWYTNGFISSNKKKD